ncbi:MAG TPA: acyl carrier protein [Candidatus Deferrimicrobiaceae bacterium]|nr:acyl carrier protein [Candidatus Deferrimicrobiaceae bacterium]
MSQPPITDRIKQFLVEHFPSARKHPLADDEHLLANGIVDSLGILDLVAYLEREFAITITDEDLVPEHFESLSRMAKFVQDRMSVSSH